jgi:hypothetical protein
MKAAVAKTQETPAETASTGSKKRRVVQQTELNPNEERRLEDLILRFQDIVVARNKKRSERERAVASEVDIIRAGLLRLEEASDEDFHVFVTKAKSRP